MSGADDDTGGVSPAASSGPAPGGVDAATHLVLVGLMGVGKSTVGRVLAERLGRRFVDSDAVVEERTGRTVREIFAESGEAAFRALERDALLGALASEEPLVIAAAGGVVLSEENRAALCAPTTRVVWLIASADTLVGRGTASAAHRPLLDDDPADALARMERDREPLYREVADALVSVEHRSVGEVVEAILR